MSFLSSFFGKKNPPAVSPVDAPQERAPTPFPVEEAVAQVQAQLRRSSNADLQEAAGVLAGFTPALASATASESAQVPTPPLSLEPAPAPATATAPALSQEPTPVPAPAPGLEPVPVSAPVPVPMPESAVPETKKPVSVAADSPVIPGIGRDEVIAAYRLFLRRDPESDTVIAPRLGMSRENLLSTFVMSPEFLQRPENIKLLLEVAQTLEDRKQVPVDVGDMPAMTEADIDAAKRIFWPEPLAQPLQPLPGQSAARALTQMMRSEHFQKNEFNAKLVTHVARQILERLNKK